MPPTPLDQDLGGEKQAILSLQAVPYRQQVIASFSATSHPLPRLQPLYFGEGPISETKVVSLLLIRETRKAPIAIVKPMRTRHSLHLSVVPPVRLVVAWVDHLLHHGLLECRVAGL